MLSSDLAEVGYQQGDGTTWVLPASEIRRLEDPSVKGIYNEYGVDLIVTGSIQHMGSTRSVNLSLVNGADGRQLKSVQLSINADNLFEEQTYIRQQVMQLIGWTIPTELQQSFAAQKPALDGAYKHYLQGQGYLYRFDHADNIERAEKSFQAAIELDKNYADAYVGLAQVQLKSFVLSKDIRLLDEMTSTVRKLSLLDSLHPLLSYLKGEINFHQGKYAESITLFLATLQQQPMFSRAYTGLSESYLQLNRLDEAEKTLLKAYKLMPNNNVVLTELGAFHYINGQYNRAIGFFDLLAKQAPNNFIAYLNISACYYLQGNMNQSILAAQKSLNIQDNHVAYSNIGTSYFGLKKYKESVEAFEKMISLNDSDYINWGNLADAYYFSQNEKYVYAYNQAIKLAKQALEVNYKNKYAIASLAYYHANLGHLEKTRNYADQITENETGEDLFVVAAAYARLGINEAALDYLNLAIHNHYSIAEIKTSPLLDSLKSDVRFKQLMVKRTTEN